MHDLNTIKKMNKPNYKPKKRFYKSSQQLNEVYTNSPYIHRDINTIAHWIINDCDDPVGEVGWLLTDLFVRGGITANKETIRTVYSTIFEHIEESEVE